MNLKYKFKIKSELKKKKIEKKLLDNRNEQNVLFYIFQYLKEDNINFNFKNIVILC